MIALERFTIAAALLALVSLAANAETPPPPPGGQGGKPNNGALEAALKTCEATVAKDVNGRPLPAAMDNCMRAKGFAPPPPPPRGQGDGKPPPPPPGQGDGKPPPPPQN